MEVKNHFPSVCIITDHLLTVNDNRFVLSLNRCTSTIQKSNTPIKTAVTNTGIPVKNKVIFGMGIFHTAYGFKVLRQAKNQCAPDVPRGQFWLRHFQIFCGVGETTQPRQNTGFLRLSFGTKLLDGESNVMFVKRYYAN